MNLNDHPNLVIYLAGCVVAFLLFLLHTVAASILSWISKDNVLKKNVNKIKDPNGVGLAVKASLYVLLALFNAAFSWLGVLFSQEGSYGFHLRTFEKRFLQFQKKLSCLDFLFETTRICPGRPSGPTCMP